MQVINSLEWYKLLKHEAKDGEKFASYDSIECNVHRLPSGRVYKVVDDVETGNRSRPIEELIVLE